MSPSRKRLIALLAFALPVAALVAPSVAEAKTQTTQSHGHKGGKAHAGKSGKGKYHAQTGKKGKSHTAARAAS